MWKLHIAYRSFYSRVLANTIPSRVNVQVEGITTESQSGFRSDRSTIDMVFAIRQLHSMDQAQNANCLHGVH